MAWQGERSKPYDLHVADNEIAGVFDIDQFGYLGSTSVGEQAIWDGGGSYTGFITAPSTLTIASNSANDNGLVPNTGARKIMVYGLDASWHPFSQEIIMNGVTDVITTTQWMRVLWAEVVEAGNSNFINGANAGTITIRATTGSLLMARIMPNAGRSLMAVWTVPADHHGKLRSYHVNLGKGNDGVFRIKYRNNKDTSNGAWKTRTGRVIYQGSFRRVYSSPIPFEEKTDIIVTVDANVSGSAASACFEMLLERGPSNPDQFFGG